MRYQACVNAVHLLRESGGILLIVTPDSSPQAKNLRMIFSWSAALAKLGAIRAYYEKLPHLHCLGFVKMGSEFADMCESESAKYFHRLGVTDIKTLNLENDLMIIPQDLTTSREIQRDEEIRENDDTESVDAWDDEEVVKTLSELPGESVVE